MYREVGQDVATIVVIGSSQGDPVLDTVFGGESDQQRIGRTRLNVNTEDGNTPTVEGEVFQAGTVGGHFQTIAP